MAAYASLVSLMHIVEQIQLHPCPPISLDKEQVESLTESVGFLQEFLEGYSHVAGYSKEADPLEMRIVDTAYAAEDVIESHIVDQIHLGSTGKISSTEFYQGLQQVIQDMDLIKEEVMGTKEKMTIQYKLHRNSSISASTWQKSTMIGFDDIQTEVMDKLTGAQPGRLICSLVGMGGSGKTTLARNIYKNKVVTQHFDILLWVTISQEYRMSEILSQLLQEGGGGTSEMDVHELGDKLHQKLYGRRYLIVMDDIWDIEVWDQLQLFFPDNNNGSRIMLTTRLYALASQIDGSYCTMLGFLDKDDSWDLFCECVFGEEDCPPELEGIGVKIMEKCKGLPLSIVVIGGLLAKSEQTRQYWEYIEENLNSIVNLEDGERCLQILYMSYNHLPVHLKPCFLYMGVFPEDEDIRASDLVKLWVAEGFLKSIDDKSLEEVAEEYLGQLVGRNLILEKVHSKDGGKIKLCKIHDLLRDLCIREAQKQKFICVVAAHGLNTPQEFNTERRICFNQINGEPHSLDALGSASRVRSLIGISDIWSYLPFFSFKLLRVSLVVNNNVNFDEHSLGVLQQVNLRYLCLDNVFYSVSMFPSSISRLWNLQTLIVFSEVTVSVPSEIWKLSQLRHVWVRENVQLPDPRTDDTVLENLQSLSLVRNLKFSEEVVKRIPNINKLKVSYEDDEDQIDSLSLLNCLHRLESFHLVVGNLYDEESVRSRLVQNLNFPHSLKKLTLWGSCLHWQDLTIIGSLPLLQVLKLRPYALMGPEWETIEGQFCSLTFLLIEYCYLEYWKTGDTHFPHLEHLVLRDLKKLREIPLSIGDISTLKLIELEDCCDPVVDSARRIQEEQMELGNEDLEILYL